MLDILLLLVLVHLSPGLRHEYSDEERHGAAHTAEVEEEAAGAEVGEDEAGALHRHPHHQEAKADGGGLHHRLQLGAEPLRCNTLIIWEYEVFLPMSIQGKLTTATPQQNMKIMRSTVKIQLIRVSSMWIPGYISKTTFIWNLLPLSLIKTRIPRVPMMSVDRLLVARYIVLRPNLITHVAVVGRITYY